MSPVDYMAAATVADYYRGSFVMFRAAGRKWLLCVR